MTVKGTGSVAGSHSIHPGSTEQYLGDLGQITEPQSRTLTEAEDCHGDKRVALFAEW